MEVMDYICSQTFASKLEQYLSIFVPQIQAKFQNQMAVNVCIFCEKLFLIGGAATQVERSEKQLQHSHFEQLAFWLIEATEAAALG